MADFYDPLHVLRVEFHAVASLEAGGVVLRFEGHVAADHQEKAQAMARAYDTVLRLQLANGGAPVRDLVAQGKLRLEEGRYLVK
jgi:hypothetical protein